MRAASLIRDSAGSPRIARPVAVTFDDRRQDAAPRGTIHAAILALVWLTFALSGFVFTEPAPVDALLAGLIALLPAAGLVTITPALAAYMSLWAIAAASGFLASTVSRDVGASTTFTTISLYLYAASFVLAAFVARAPLRHARIVHSGWLVAAVLAAVAALVGYFNLVPGAADLFTKFSRASGPFKDPNVFGPFLVAPFLYALHLVLHRPWTRAIGPVLAASILALAVLLSFSRGAWLNLLVALVVYGALAFSTATSPRQREKIVGLIAGGMTLVTVLTVAVLADDKVGGFLQERASVTQSYDVGPAGRFGGQDKAVGLILEHPLGIGAGQFTIHHHHEEVHNVFLSIFLNAGWLGGLIYWLMTALTLVIGGRHVMQPGPSRPLFLIAYAAFVATALEGIVIDTDHWRGFYILMALVWGAASSGESPNARMAD
jgi:hypothetical protein